MSVYLSVHQNTYICSCEQTSINSVNLQQTSIHMSTCLYTWIHTFVAQWTNLNKQCQLVSKPGYTLLVCTPEYKRLLLWENLNKQSQLISKPGYTCLYTWTHIFVAQWTNLNKHSQHVSKPGHTLSTCLYTWIHKLVAATKPEQTQSACQHTTWIHTFIVVWMPEYTQTTCQQQSAWQHSLLHTYIATFEYIRIHLFIAIGTTESAHSSYRSTSINRTHFWSWKDLNECTCSSHYPVSYTFTVVTSSESTQHL